MICTCFFRLGYLPGDFEIQHDPHEMYLKYTEALIDSFAATVEDRHAARTGASRISDQIRALFTGTASFVTMKDGKPMRESEQTFKSIHAVVAGAPTLSSSIRRSLNTTESVSGVLFEVCSVYLHVSLYIYIYIYIYI